MTSLIRIVGIGLGALAVASPLLINATPAAALPQAPVSRDNCYGEVTDLGMGQIYSGRCNSRVADGTGGEVVVRTYRITAFCKDPLLGGGYQIEGPLWKANYDSTTPVCPFRIDPASVRFDLNPIR